MGFGDEALQGEVVGEEGGAVFGVVGGGFLGFGFVVGFVLVPQDQRE